MQETTTALAHGVPEPSRSGTCRFRSSTPNASYDSLHPGFGAPLPAGVTATAEEYPLWLITQLERLVVFAGVMASLTVDGGVAPARGLGGVHGVVRGPQEFRGIPIVVGLEHHYTDTRGNRDVVLAVPDWLNDGAVQVVGNSSDVSPTAPRQKQHDELVAG